MDSKQSEIIEKYQDQLLKDKSDDNESDDSLSELFNEDELVKFREQRIQQLESEFKKIKRNVEYNQYGQVITIIDEKEVMDTVVNNENVLIHFYLDNFNKCIKMDEKLTKLSQKQLNLKILRINVTNAKFLVVKLGIKVLPFVVCYKRGVEVDRLVGFAKLGNDPNDFKVEVLENYLLRIGLVNRQTVDFKSIRSKKLDDDSEEEFD